MELFYYTSTDTLYYVLSKGDIFATNIRYMNDSEEYINGLQELYELAQKKELVTEWIKEKGLNESLLSRIENTFTERNLKENRETMEYYSISFCEKNDILSQWAIYAKESGVSIKMNFEKELYEFSTKSIEKEQLAKWNLLPQKVYYFTYQSMKQDEEQYKRVAYEVLNQLYEESAKDQAEWKNERWRYISTLVKRYDFYQEKEYRLVFEPNETTFPPYIEYRPDKKVLKPYLDIECDRCFGWPIWEVMIGPGFNQQVVYDSVEHLLNNGKLKVGIKNTEDYVKRVKEYLQPNSKDLETCKEYKELIGQIQQSDRSNQITLEEAKIYIVQKLREIRKEVCENNSYSKDIKNYFNKYHFTESGVVITKSSIPYIF